MRIHVRMALALTVLIGAAGCDKKADTPTAGETTMAPREAPPGTDWTETVAVTPEGGYVMGNPDAPVKFVEYASFTCSHCRDFARDATASLRDTYVKSGNVSWELRSFPLNPIDVAATLLVTCQGPGPVFKLMEQTFLEQDKWIQPYQKLTEQQQNQIAAMPEDQQFLGLARAGGLDTFYRVRGLPAARAEACLTDKAKIDAVVAMRDRGIKEDNVEGTPSFMINGEKIEEPPSWSAIEPVIKKAIG
ncbi:MAG: thioredoxin domain-containing protein [Sphingomonadaceae bacterium]